MEHNPGDSCLEAHDYAFYQRNKYWLVNEVDKYLDLNQSEIMERQEKLKREAEEQANILMMQQ